MAAIELVGVSKDYGRNTVVEDVSFTVAEGEFISLLGPSGCGKTTTLRMIAGFITPTRGDIRIGGKRINDLPPHRRDTGMVFQQYALFPHMSVFDNVAFGLRMHKAPADVIKRQVTEALAMVKLAGYEQRMIRQLSGGQQQRVAVARALAVRPQVLLLDEPLSNLDAKLRAETRVELRRIQKETGITAIFVTHDQEEALIVSDRVAVMNKGHLEQIGTPSHIYEEPATRFVADFIGRTNFVRGRIDGGRFTTAGGQTISLPAISLNGAATISVRPERIGLLPAGASAAANAASAAANGAGAAANAANAAASTGAVIWPARVQRVIYMGDRSEVMVQMGEDNLSVLVPNAAPLPAELSEGKDVLLSIRPDDCRVFPEEAL